MFTEPTAQPRCWSIVEGMPTPIAPTSSSRELLNRRIDLGKELFLAPERRRAHGPLHDDAFLVQDAGQELRPAEVDSDHAGGVHRPAATITRPGGRQGQAIPRLQGGSRQRADPPRASEGGGGPPRRRRVHLQRARSPPASGDAGSDGSSGRSSASSSSFSSGPSSGTSPSGAGSRTRTSGSIRWRPAPSRPRKACCSRTPSNILVLGADTGSKTPAGRAGARRHDHPHPHRPGPPQDRAPLHPSRPPGGDPAPRNGEDQRGVCVRWPDACPQDGRTRDRPPR